MGLAKFFLAVGKENVDEMEKPLMAQLEIVDDGYQLLKGSYCRIKPRGSFTNIVILTVIALSD